MKINILFIERQPSEAVSIEKVFRQVDRNLSREKFKTAFQKLLYSNDTLGTIKNLLFFRPQKADVYHVTGHIHYISLILPVEKTILTIHDVGILHIRKGFRRFVLKKLLFDIPIKRLKYITAVSETTKKELVKFTNCDESKIRVIENPLQEHFQNNQRKSFDKEYPTILQIGTTANKNLKNLAAALEGIACRLIIVGTLDSYTQNLLKSNKIDFETHSKLKDEEIREIYAKADLVTFCSTFEGFGLPLIEAQAMKKPVVTSDLSPMREVSGDAAVLTDPFDPKSIREGILRIINDEELRESLISKGLENIKKYDPVEIGAAYEDLYREVFANSTETEKG